MDDAESDPLPRAARLGSSPPQLTHEVITFTGSELLPRKIDPSPLRKSVFSKSEATTTVLPHVSCPNAPHPRINRYLMFFIFCVFLGICSGPAYNANAVKQFLRYLHPQPMASAPHAATRGTARNVTSDSWSSQEDTALRSGLKIFQTSDVIMGAFIGPLFDSCGPRVTHTLGYLFFAGGVYGMVADVGSRYLCVALSLQGVAACTTLSSSLHLANLFQRGGKFSMCLLTAVVELGQAVFPLMNYAVESASVSPSTCVYILSAIGLAGAVVTLLLFPDSPFVPADERVREMLRAASIEDQLQVVTGRRPDRRDRWARQIRRARESLKRFVSSGDQGGPGEVAAGDMTEEKPLLPSDKLEGEGRLRSAGESAKAPDIPVTITTAASATEDEEEGPPFLCGGRGRSSLPAMSVSVASAALAGTSGKVEVVPVRHSSLKQQLLSLEFMTVTLVFSFFVVRNNLFLDFNEISFRCMGDDGSVARWAAALMPFALVPAVLNGLIMELTGVVPLLLGINFCSIAVNLLGTTQLLQLQTAAVILFLFARASVWSCLFSYCLERFGISHFVVITGVALALSGSLNQAIGLILNPRVPHPVTPVMLDWVLVIGGLFVTLPIWFLSVRRSFPQII